MISKKVIKKYDKVRRSAKVVAETTKSEQIVKSIRKHWRSKEYASSKLHQEMSKVRNSICDTVGELTKIKENVCCECNA